MEQTQYQYYFDLTTFKHKILFEESPDVWDVLQKLGPYLKQYPLGKIETDIPQGVHLVLPELISIGKGSIIEPGAYIRGPCIIGESCQIRHGAYLRGNVIAGDRCVLGHDSEFKNALLLNDVRAAHFAYVGDTILGNRVNLGAGTICANLRLDNKPVAIVCDGRHLETGLRKFGAILGDEVQTGSHTVTNPGTLMGPQARSHPCINFGGVIPPGQVVRSENKTFCSDS